MCIRDRSCSADTYVGKIHAGGFCGWGDSWFGNLGLGDLNLGLGDLKLAYGLLVGFLCLGCMIACYCCCKLRRRRPLPLVANNEQSIRSQTNVEGASQADPHQVLINGKTWTQTNQIDVTEACF